MEETKTTDFSARPADEKGVITGCPFWFFGDEESATNDMNEMFDIVD